MIHEPIDAVDHARLILLMILPFIFTNNSALTIMNQMWITVIFALAYNMLLGQGGMLSFGHAVLCGCGGFACMHIMNMSDFALPLPWSSCHSLAACSAWALR